MQVRLAHNDHMIQALPANAADEALAGRVHQWRLHRGLQHSNTSALRNAIEVRTELAVTVSNDELRSLPERRDLPELLSRPSCVRRTSHTDVHDLLGVHVDDEKREQRPVPECTQST